jgi:hypothetical protein
MVKQSLSRSERPDLIGLQFMDEEIFKHPTVEPHRKGRCPLQPASHCSPAHPLDSRNGRDTNFVNTHANDFIEQGPGLM